MKFIHGNENEQVRASSCSLIGHWVIIATFRRFPLAALREEEVVVCPYKRGSDCRVWK